jgi:protein N-terminal methyltransferase
LVAFLKRALLAVQPKQGWVIIKENLASGGVDHLVDEEDSSVTRSEECWRRLLQEAGARLVQEQLQTGFPPGLFRVKSFVLQ